MVGARNASAAAIRFARTLAQDLGQRGAVVHTDEPLRRGAEDDRRLVSPAVRVAVLDFFSLEQALAGFEFLQHQRVGFPNGLAGQLRDRQGGRVGEELAVVADRVVHRQAINAADLVVVGTVRRGGVHEAGTGFERDVLAADEAMLCNSLIGFWPIARYQQRRWSQFPAADALNRAWAEAG